jgi:hypothetical protein
MQILYVGRRIGNDAWIAGGARPALSREQSGFLAMEFNARAHASLAAAGQDV